MKYDWLKRNLTVVKGERAVVGLAPCHCNKSKTSHCSPSLSPSSTTTHLTSLDNFSFWVSSFSFFHIFMHLDWRLFLFGSRRLQFSKSFLFPFHWVQWQFAHWVVTWSDIIGGEAYLLGSEIWVCLCTWFLVEIIEILLNNLANLLWVYLGFF